MPVWPDQVAGDAWDGSQRADGRPEQFHGHDDGGDRRIGRAGEPRDEADGGQHRERQVQQRRHRIAQGGPDVEKRRDLAALEAGAQRCNGEDQLAQEVPWCDRCLEDRTIVGMPRPM